LKKAKSFFLADIQLVLVLAGVELIFFIVASMELYFGFVLETVDEGMF